MATTNHYNMCVLAAMDLDRNVGMIATGTQKLLASERNLI